MDFDTVADELYAGDPAEFVAARNAAAKAAKAEGDAELAARIRELRKPTTAAAIVNRLAHEGSTALADLADLGERLRSAHTRLAGDDLRALTRERGERIRAVMHELPSMSDSVSREVESTLEAVVADPSVAGLAVAGRLASGAQQDADQWFSLAAAAPPATAKRPVKLVEKAEPAKPKRADQAQKRAERDRLDKEERERRAREAREERERLRRAAAERAKDRAVAQRDLFRAEHAAEQATARLEDLRARLADAEKRAEQATADLEKAKASFEQAEEAARAAEEAVESAYLSGE